MKEEKSFPTINTYLSSHCDHMFQVLLSFNVLSQTKRSMSIRACIQLKGLSLGNGGEAADLPEGFPRSAAFRVESSESGVVVVRISASGSFSASDVWIYPPPGATARRAGRRRRKRRRRGDKMSDGTGHNGYDSNRSTKWKWLH